MRSTKEVRLPKGGTTAWVGPDWVPSVLVTARTRNWTGTPFASGENTCDVAVPGKYFTVWNTPAT